MKIFDSADPITILSFTPAFKTARDSTGVQEGEEMWLFEFVRKTTRNVLTSRTTATDYRRKSRESQLTSYHEVVNFLLRTYATEELIAETDAALSQCCQGERVSPTDYAQELWTKALKRGSVYDEARLKGIFIKGLHEIIRQSVHKY